MKPTSRDMGFSFRQSTYSNVGEIFHFTMVPEPMYAITLISLFWVSLKLY